MQDLSTHFKKPITHYVVAVFPFFLFPFSFERGELLAPTSLLTTRPDNTS